MNKSREKIIPTRIREIRVSPEHQLATGHCIITAPSQRNGPCP